MRLLYLSVLVITIQACGFNGEQRFDATQSGTSTTDISVTFAFIDQVEKLCVMDTLVADYATADLYNKAVAECTFAKLSTINVAQVCNTPGLTPAQLNAMERG